MNREEFFEEVTKAQIGPDNFETIYNEFGHFQNLALETLREFHNVCEKNGIDYQLTFGTLLGVVRDNGMIPWDYDIDVLVSITEKEKLVEALSRDLNPNYYFYCPESDRECRHVIMRLTPEGYRSEVLHVDVFYFTGSPDDSTDRKKHALKIKQISEMRYDKFVKVLQEASSFRNLVKMVLLKFRTMFISERSLRHKYESLVSKYNPKDSKYCITADTFADWYELPSEFLLETELIETSMGSFRVPVRRKELLKLFYEDYRKLYPVSDRLAELIKNHKKLVKQSQKK
ncbi:LicD family protein [Streptococcus sp. S784/96/1]|uniref:LicD family protein n=1 Tax=Streptococcus sp. S784/96/1 TaxID=2653499 RepID=UPI001389BA0F|nr:LicD family protein [Streptococcus sp. S784/96/1]